MSRFNFIYAEEELPHRAKSVYIYLRDRMNAEGMCWYAVNTIAADLGFSRSTVKRALHDLDHAGLVVKQRRYRENGSCTSNILIVKQES
jgi:DNA-binding MarR family transcriptional regulator